MNRRKILKSLRQENDLLFKGDRGAREKESARNGRRAARGAVIGFAALALVVCIVLGVVFLPGTGGGDPETRELIVTLSINPGFEIKSEQGTVTALRALNRDAAIVLAGMPSFVGQPLETATGALIAAAQAEGYLADGATVTLSVVGGADEKSAYDRLLAALSADVGGSVTIVGDYDPGKEKEAKKYKVSAGHYLLAERAAAAAGGTAADYVSKNAEELNAIIYGYGEDVAEFERKLREKIAELEAQKDAEEERLEAEIDALEAEIERAVEQIEEGSDYRAVLAAITARYGDFDGSDVRNAEEARAALEKFGKQKEKEAEALAEETEKRLEREIKELKSSLKDKVSGGGEITDDDFEIDDDDDPEEEERPGEDDQDREFAQQVQELIERAEETLGEIDGADEEERAELLEELTDAFAEFRAEFADICPQVETIAPPTADHLASFLAALRDLRI